MSATEPISGTSEEISDFAFDLEIDADSWHLHLSSSDDETTTEELAEIEDLAGNSREISRQNGDSNFADENLSPVEKESRAADAFISPQPPLEHCFTSASAIFCTTEEVEQSSPRNYVATSSSASPENREDHDPEPDELVENFDKPITRSLRSKEKTSSVSSGQCHCVVCGVQIGIWSLRQHIRCKHFASYKPVICPFCHKRFALVQPCSVHISKLHMAATKKAKRSASFFSQRKSQNNDENSNRFHLTQPDKPTENLIERLTLISRTFRTEEQRTAALKDAMASLNNNNNTNLRIAQFQPSPKQPCIDDVAVQASAQHSENVEKEAFLALVNLQSKNAKFVCSSACDSLTLSPTLTSTLLCRSFAASQSNYQDTVLLTELERMRATVVCDGETSLEVCSSALATESFQEYILQQHAATFQAFAMPTTVETARTTVDEECAACQIGLTLSQDNFSHCVFCACKLRRGNGNNTVSPTASTSGSLNEVTSRRCRLCNQTVTVFDANRQTLEAHALSHVEPIPFSCPYCELSHFDINVLKKHVKSSHEGGFGVVINWEDVEEMKVRWRAVVDLSFSPKQRRRRKN